MADKRTAKERAEDRPSNEFYESMPGVMNDFYRRYDEYEAQENLKEADQPMIQTEHMGRQAKTTAIITIILTIIVALAMAMLFIKGVEVIRHLAPPGGNVGAQSQNY
jgi:hypothetical protein